MTTVQAQDHENVRLRMTEVGVSFVRFGMSKSGETDGSERRGQGARDEPTLPAMISGELADRFVTRGGDAEL